MDQPPEQIQSELESFRAQWRAEVTARSRHTPTGEDAIPQRAQPSQVGPSSTSAASAKTSQRKGERPAHKRLPSTVGISQHPDEDLDYLRTQHFDEDVSRFKEPSLLDEGTSEKEKEPETALEYYEKAVDLETSGKLGDSLQLYRKAYRLDTRVDRVYREKHFPGQWKKKPTGSQPVQPNPSDAPATVPDPAHPSTAEQPERPLTHSELIASFAGLSLQPAPPEIEGTPAPPCPIADLPEEIIAHVMQEVAILDVGDFVRLSQVCKRFAYLVATQNRIWRRVCLGHEFGFAGMVHHWQRGVSWEELSFDAELLDDDADGNGDVLTISELHRRRAVASEATSLSLFTPLANASATRAAANPSPGYPSWQRMFRARPRIRFNGCYISTVNYIRTGHSSGNHITWNSPVHIVTYYRYLRFFRDGTCLSLQTSAEPADVVHHLTKPLLLQYRKASGGAHLPGAVMAQALKGRWKLSSGRDKARGSDDDHDADMSIMDAEGDLYVETEGAQPKYTYHMELSLKSAGKARNNKLSWKGFWCYNKLTEDGSDFGLKNGRAFYFSRVKSYGFAGE